MAESSRRTALKRRHLRVRAKVKGTPQRPRLCLHKSLRHLYGQVVDDRSGTTLAFATTNRKANKGDRKSFRNVEWAKKLGSEIAQQAVKNGINTVVFDRSGYPYHGVIRAFAESAREAGLKF